MELIILVLLVLVALSSLFQMSHWGIIARGIAAIVLSGFAYATYPWIIEQSKEQLSEWMSDSAIMQNFAVILVIESISFILINLSVIPQYFDQSVKKYNKSLRYFPGILLLAVILYVQMMCFYSFSSIDFDKLGIYFSIFLALALFFGPMGIRWIIPEPHLRMELRYILNFGQVLGGIVITVFCQGATYPNNQNEFNWLAPLWGVLGIFLIAITIGYVAFRIIKRTKFKWRY